MTRVSRVTCYVLRVMSKTGNGCAKRDVGTVQVPEGGERRGEIF